MNDLAVPTRLAYASPATPTARTLREPPAWWRRASDRLAAWDGNDRLVFALLAVGLSAAYLLLYHPYWVRGGDAEVYLGIARSLARGEGYVYNGQPVSLVPPGWPLVLAGAMKVSAGFGWLKLLTMGSILGFVLIWYRILCRYTLPLRAGLLMGVVGMLYPVLPLTFTFMSDGPFCLLTAAALLVALQINEGRDSGWRVAGCAALVAASVSVRWPGILFLPIVCGALVGGRAWWRPQLDRRWVAVGVVIVVTFATFFGLRAWLVVDPAELDPRYDTFLSTTYDLNNQTNDPTAETYRRRLTEHTPRWLAGLLWEPLARSGPTKPVSDFFGWRVLVIPLIAGVAVNTGRRRWVYLGAIAYWLPLLLTWPDPVHRYLIPVLPVMLLAVWQGVGPLARLFRDVWPRRIAHGLFYGVVGAVFAGVVLLNGALWAMEVRIARSGQEFYDRYDAGLYASLNDIGAWLALNASDQVEVAVSQGRFQAGKSPFFTAGHMRALNWVADRPVVMVPEEMSYLPSKSFVEWAEARNIRYYVFQPSHRQLLHYRALPWDPKIEEYRRQDMGFHLFLIRRGRAKQIWVGTEFDPAHVPGLGDGREVREHSSELERQLSPKPRKAVAG